MNFMFANIYTILCGRFRQEKIAWGQVDTLLCQVLILKVKGKWVIKTQRQGIGREGWKLVGKEGKSGRFPCSNLGRLYSAAYAGGRGLTVERGHTTPRKNKCDEQNDDSAWHKAVLVGEEKDADFYDLN